MKTVECRQCQKRFSAPSRMRRTCDECKRANYQRRVEEKRTEQPWRWTNGRLTRPRRKGKPKPVQLPTDFLLALPEMRRELERQCQDFGVMRRDFGAADLLELPATGRRRSA